MYPSSNQAAEEAELMDRIASIDSDVLTLSLSNVLSDEKTTS